MALSVARMPSNPVKSHPSRRRPPFVVFAVVIGLAACAAPAKRPLTKATARSDGPAHAIEIAQGMWTCERGYLMRNHQCIPEDLVANEQRFRVYDPTADLGMPSEARKRERALTAMPGFKWNEADFPPRPVVEHPFSIEASSFTTVIGEPTHYTLPEQKTMYEAARHLGLGVNQVFAALPHVDFLEPPGGYSYEFPTWWILPQSDYRGLVINVPELRLYYFPESNPGRVITYPVGLGDDAWQTPIARFKVIEKNVDPAWYIPESIRAEHIRERNDPRTMIPGGAADNPLGHYRLKLSLPLYGIHGTNVPWGIGMEVTHGCIRLYPEDIERLYPLVPVGTPGEFVYQPVKIGARGDAIYIEVHPDIYETSFNYLEYAMRSLAARGWKERVDWQLLTDAIEAKRGTPTRIGG